MRGYHEVHLLDRMKAFAKDVLMLMAYEMALQKEFLIFGLLVPRMDEPLEMHLALSKDDRFLQS